MECTIHIQSSSNAKQHSSTSHNQETQTEEEVICLNNVLCLVLQDQSTNCNLDRAEKERLLKKIEFYQEKVKQMSLTIRKLKSKQHEDEIIKERLVSRGMTENMARQYIGKRRKYSKKVCVKDVVFGASLRGLSPRTFRFIRNKSMIRIPSHRTIGRFLSHFKIRAGDI